MWWSVPVSSIARVGEQVGAVWKPLSRIPANASASRCGVLISPPNAPRSEKPRSSATMIREFGRPAAALSTKAGSPRRHFREALPFTTQAHPSLGAVAKDLRRRLDPALVVERARRNHHDIGHHLGLLDDRRGAFRAEPAVGRFAGVAMALERLQRALHADRRLRQRHHHVERGSGASLAVGAVAHADKGRLGLGRIAHLAAQATTFDLHPILPLFTRTIKSGGPP